MGAGSSENSRDDECSNVRSFSDKRVDGAGSDAPQENCSFLF
jgi:hypothetical protein